MKKLLICAASVSITSLILSLISFSFVNKNDLRKWYMYFDFNDELPPSALKDYEFEKTYSFSSKDRLSLKIPKGKVKVYSSQANELKIHILGKVEKTRTFDISDYVFRKGNTIELNLFRDEQMESKNWLKLKKQMFSVLSGDLKVEVEIPREFGELDMKGFSVNFLLSDIHPEKIRLNVVDGNLNLTNVRAEDMEVNSISGDVELHDSSFTKVTMSTVSGDIEFKSTLQERYAIYFESISGDLEGSSLFKDEASAREITIESVSGDVTFKRE